MRSSMGQERLNHIAMLNVHQERVDNIDVVSIAEAFVSKCDSRRAIFGKYTDMKNT